MGLTGLLDHDEIEVGNSYYGERDCERIVETEVRHCDSQIQRVALRRLCDRTLPKPAVR
jgi:hypothetical protein